MLRFKNSCYRTQLASGSGATSIKEYTLAETPLEVNYSCNPHIDTYRRMDARGIADRLWLRGNLYDRSDDYREGGVIDAVLPKGI